MHRPTVAAAIFSLVLVFLCRAVQVDAVSVQDYDDEYWQELQQLTNDSDYGVTWTYMPDGFGIPRVALLTEPPATNSRMTVAKGNVNFYLYTGSGNRQGKNLDSIQAVKDEFGAFDPNRWTVFLVHGWLANEQKGGIPLIRENYFRNDGVDVNLITVDWEDLASNYYYFESARRTNDVGQTIAELIDYMVSNMSLSLDRVHLIGHSLGAHTAGYAGRYVKSGKVRRITGLDPAGPFFYLKGPDQRLDPTDAQFVDVIHTAVGSAGHYKNMGHVDFFPNGGIYQPGCGSTIILKESCSHGRSQEFFAESLYNDNFYGYKCRNFHSLRDGKCDTSGDDYAMMGYHVSMEARGKYYVEVEKSAPYARGPKEGRDDCD